MKSVMRSSMLLGSRTKVGNVTFERSMPTLWREWVGPTGGEEEEEVREGSSGSVAAGIGGGCAPKLRNEG